MKTFENALLALSMKYDKYYRIVTIKKKKKSI